MKNTDIKKMSKDELQKTLKELCLYRDLTNELGTRWKELFQRIQYGTHSYQVEHFTAVSADVAWSSAQEVFTKVFDVQPKKDEVQFIEKSSLKWGIKVYFDDEVVDLSFDKIEKSLINS